MNKNRIPQAIIILVLLFIFSFILTKEGWKDNKISTPKIYAYNKYEIIEPEKYNYPEYNLKIAYYNNWYKPTHLVHETVTEYELEYVYLGNYYLTAYSPQETGSWETASGATLHRADYENRLTEPTTCAIDRSLHNFGDLFYIPAFDRVFVAEDTGGAVRGKHLDLGYTDLESVWSFPTGYYEVYAVEYVYYDIEVEYYDFDKVPGIVRLAYLQKDR